MRPRNQKSAIYFQNLLILHRDFGKKCKIYCFFLHEKMSNYHSTFG